VSIYMSSALDVFCLGKTSVNSREAVDTGLLHDGIPQILLVRVETIQQYAGGTISTNRASF
jgi:hypothetical protein